MSVNGTVPEIFNASEKRHFFLSKPSLIDNFPKLNKIIYTGISFWLTGVIVTGESSITPNLEKKFGTDDSQQPQGWGYYNPCGTVPLRFYAYSPMQRTTLIEKIRNWCFAATTSLRWQYPSGTVPLRFYAYSPMHHTPHPPSSTRTCKELEA